MCFPAPYVKSFSTIVCVRFAWCSSCLQIACFLSWAVFDPRRSFSVCLSLSCSAGAKTKARLYVPDTLPGFVYVSHAYLSHGLVQEEGFADVLDLGDRALEVEGFGEDDLEDLGWRLD